MDFLQGASNAAASNVSGPVDLLAFALRKMGFPVPEDPVLGAKWMADRGITAQPQNKVAGMLGETAGLVAPIAAAARAPEIAANLVKHGEQFQAYNQALGPAGASQMVPTVMRPKRVAYPEIYSSPAELAAEAASRVAPENPLLKRLFGVDREELFAISQQGRRQGNITERPFAAAANAKGAAHASDVQNPRNVRRLQDIIGEAEKHPELFQGMASWYTMDPLYSQFVRLHGKNAVPAYNKFNTLTGMASPGSEVLTELNRGTAANWLSNQGRFADFQKYGGMAESRRGAGFPDDMRGIIGHPYHSTAQAGPMADFLERGAVEMGSAKVPSYIAASGVPETGFQTAWPVGDAHWSRLVGLADVRGAATRKGLDVVPGASASVPEMTSLGPWWAEKVAAPMGLQAVPAQAVVWGAGSGATGVTSPIGAGKLELLAQQIGITAKRLGISPERARDLILMGKTHAGAAAGATIGLGSIASLGDSESQ